VTNSVLIDLLMGWFIVNVLKIKKMSFRKNHPLVKIVNSTLIDLPAPANLSVN
jgi:hypothetical protein